MIYIFKDLEAGLKKVETRAWCYYEPSDVNMTASRRCDCCRLITFIQSRDSFNIQYVWRETLFYVFRVKRTVKKVTVSDGSRGGRGMGGGGRVVGEGMGCTCTSSSL